MSNNIVIYGYGGSSSPGVTNIPIYGYGQSPTGNIIAPYLTPLDSGPMAGGTSFIILGSTQTAKFAQDLFATFNSSFWLDTSAGGTVSISDGLKLLTPLTGGTATVQSKISWFNFDAAVYFNYDSSMEQYHPNIEYTILQYTVKFDATNYFYVSHIWDPVLDSQAIKIANVSNGVPTELLRKVAKSQSRYLRIVRWGGTLYVYAGADLVFTYAGWYPSSPAGIATIELSSHNVGSIPAALNTHVTLFMPRITVGFGDVPCTSIDEIPLDRIFGVTPPNTMPRIVDVVMYGVGQPGNTTAQFDTLYNAWTYIAPLQLSLDANGVMTISSDDTLRDSSTTLRGLRTNG